MCFFFNDTATTEIYTLSLHDALPIYYVVEGLACSATAQAQLLVQSEHAGGGAADGEHALAHAEVEDVEGGHSPRSEEHTSELQSRQYLVCRLLLAKKPLRAEGQRPAT